MRTLLQVDPTAAVPIWKQIETGLRRQVLAQGLAPGTAVPSVRELARDLSINPATVAKAYQHLVEAGLLTMRRGEGTFVADHSPSQHQASRDQLAAEAAHSYAQVARGLGLDRDQAQRMLDQAWATPLYSGDRS